MYSLHFQKGHMKSDVIIINLFSGSKESPILKKIFIILFLLQNKVICVLFAIVNMDINHVIS